MTGGISFDDLEDDLDAVVPVATVHRQDLVPQHHQDFTESYLLGKPAQTLYRDPCEKCEGTGMWRGVKPCFACKGIGYKEFTTPKEHREKLKGKRDAKIAANLAAMEAAHPDILKWAREMAQRDHILGQTVYGQIKKHGLAMPERYYKTARTCIAKRGNTKP